MALLWLILKRYTILEDFFLLDFFLSVRYRDDVMTTLKFDWSNLKILMSSWYRKLTLSCVSFTIYHQCHTDIESDVTPMSLQYQNVHWEENDVVITIDSIKIEVGQKLLLKNQRRMKRIFFFYINIHHIYKLITRYRKINSNKR